MALIHYNFVLPFMPTTARSAALPVALSLASLRQKLTGWLRGSPRAKRKPDIQPSANHSVLPLEWAMRRRSLLSSEEITVWQLSLIHI